MFWYKTDTIVKISLTDQGDISLHFQLICPIKVAYYQTIRG